MIPLWKMHSNLRFLSQEESSDQRESKEDSKQEMRPYQNPHSSRGSNKKISRGMKNPRLNVFIVIS
jgi:hypothetical protein